MIKFCVSRLPDLSSLRGVADLNRRLRQLDMSKTSKSQRYHKYYTPNDGTKDWFALISGGIAVLLKAVLEAPSLLVRGGPPQRYACDGQYAWVGGWGGPCEGRGGGPKDEELVSVPLC